MGTSALGCSGIQCLNKAISVHMLEQSLSICSRLVKATSVHMLEQSNLRQAALLEEPWPVNISDVRPKLPPVLRPTQPAHPPPPHLAATHSKSMAFGRQAS